MTNGASHRPKTTMTEQNLPPKKEEKEVVVPEVPVVEKPAEVAAQPAPVVPVVTPPAEDKGTPAPVVVPEKKPEDVTPVVTEKRPVAFIPLKKYHDETRELKAKITELEAIVAKPATATAPAEVNVAAMEAWAEKNGLDPESVPELIALLPKPNTGVTMTPEALEEFNKIVNTNKETARQEFEKKDWQDNALPTIKELFPTATEDQLKAAQEFLDPISHSEEGVNMKYSSIVFENRKELAKIFSAEPAKPVEAPKDKSTLEHGRNGAGAPARLTVKDFAGDTPDFSILDDISPEDKTALVKSFEGPTYKKYLAHVAKNQPLEVNRGGKKILLK